MLVKIKEFSLCGVLFCLPIILSFVFPMKNNKSCKSIYLDIILPSIVLPILSRGFERFILVENRKAERAFMARGEPGMLSVNSKSRPSGTSVESDRPPPR